MDVFIGGAAADGDCFKGDAMTHDELVRFAAGKVGYTGMMDDGNGRRVSQRLLIDLTSPELFLKGLEVCPYEVTINKDRVRNGMSSLPNTIELWSPGMGAEKSVRQIADIPLTFWQCWAELEGGQG